MGEGERKEKADAPSMAMAMAIAAISSSAVVDGRRWEEDLRGGFFFLLEL